MVPSLALSLERKGRCTIEPADLAVASYDGKLNKLDRQTILPIRVEETSFHRRVFLVSELPADILLGCDFLVDAHALINFSQGVVRLHDGTHEAITAFQTAPVTPARKAAALHPRMYKERRQLKRSRRQERLARRRRWSATIRETTTLEPGTQHFVPCWMPLDHVGQEGVIEPSHIDPELLPAEHFFRKAPLNASLLIANISPLPRTLHRGTLVGRFVPLHPSSTTLATLTTDGTRTTLEMPVPVEASDNPPPLATRIAPRTRLTPTQLRRLKELLERNADLVSTLSDPGKTDLLPFKIDTGEARPIRRPPYRNPREADFIDQVVEEKVRQGLIQRSPSEWSFPVIVVRDSGKKPRVCVDYRLLNEVTKTDAYVLPRQDDTLDALGGATIFSTLDLARGFHQQVVDPASRPKTAFSTRRGLWEWTRLPFGVKNGSASFQRLMQLVLQKVCWKCCLLYLDDIIVYSRSFDAHLHHLQEVFDALRQAGLRVRSEKCHFGAHSISYLGHIISPEGIRVDPEKIRGITDFARPTTYRQLRRFLGMVNYHRRFVEHYAALAAPLTDLLKNPEDPKRVQPLAWNDKAAHSFVALKAALTRAPLLAYPDYKRRFTLATDASAVATGATIFQEDAEGSLRPIAHAYHRFTGAQVNWSIPEKELFALVHAARVFRPYLYGTKFVWLTDAKALTWIRHTNLTSKLTRWSLLLQELDFTVQHIPGVSNLIPDALSRQESLAAIAVAPRQPFADPEALHPLAPPHDISDADTPRVIPLASITTAAGHFLYPSRVAVALRRSTRRRIPTFKTRHDAPRPRYAHSRNATSTSLPPSDPTTELPSLPARDLSSDPPPSTAIPKPVSSEQPPDAARTLEREPALQAPPSVIPSKPPVSSRIPDGPPLPDPPDEFSPTLVERGRNLFHPTPSEPPTHSRMKEAVPGRPVVPPSMTLPTRCQMRDAQLADPRLNLPLRYLESRDSLPPTILRRARLAARSFVVEAGLLYKVSHLRGDRCLRLAVPPPM